jgi:hypothetical protein
VISALFFASRHWRRHVSPWRVAAAVAALIAGDIIVGSVVAALLGAFAGKSGGA